MLFHGIYFLLPIHWNSVKKIIPEQERTEKRQSNLGWIKSKQFPITRTAALLMINWINQFKASCKCDYLKYQQTKAGRRSVCCWIKFLLATMEISTRERPRRWLTSRRQPRLSMSKTKNARDRERGSDAGKSADN